MSRASIYYDASYLRDILFFEGVRTVRQTASSSGLGDIHIDLSDDSLLDDLVTALSAEQRDRKVAALKSEVKRLEAQHRDAIAARQARRDEWEAADIHEREIHSKLYDAEQALAELQGDV